MLTREVSQERTTSQSDQLLIEQIRDELSRLDQRLAQLLRTNRLNPYQREPQGRSSNADVIDIAAEAEKPPTSHHSLRKSSESSVLSSISRKERMTFIRIAKQIIEEEEQAGRTLDKKTEPHIITPQYRPKLDTRALFNFHGKPGEDLNDWFFTMERFFIKNSVPETQKVDWAVDHLREGARSSYRCLENSENFTWDELKGALKTRYVPKNLQAHLRKQLASLKQGENTISAHISAFEIIMTQIKNMSEEDKIDRFIESCNQELGNRIGYEEPKTLTEAKNLARRIDTYFPSQPKKTLRFQEKQIPGYLPNPQQAPAYQQLQPTGQYWSLNRQQPNSTSFHQQENPGNNQPSRDQYQYKPKRANPCRRCGLQWQWSHQCPNKPMHEANSVTYVGGTQGNTSSIGLISGAKAPNPAIDIDNISLGKEKRKTSPLLPFQNNYKAREIDDCTVEKSTNIKIIGAYSHTQNKISRVLSFGWIQKLFLIITTLSLLFKPGWTFQPRNKKHYKHQRHTTQRDHQNTLQNHKHSAQQRRQRQSSHGTLRIPREQLDSQAYSKAANRNRRAYFSNSTQRTHLHVPHHISRALSERACTATATAFCTKST